MTQLPKYNTKAFEAFSFYTNYLLDKARLGDWDIVILHEPIGSFIAQTWYDYAAKKIEITRNKEVLMHEGPEIFNDKDEAKSAFHEVLHACLVDLERVFSEGEFHSEEKDAEFSAQHHSVIHRFERMFFDNFYAEASKARG